MDEKKLLDDLNNLHEQLFLMAFSALTQPAEDKETELINVAFASTIQKVMLMIDHILVMHGDVR